MWSVSTSINYLLWNKTNDFEFPSRWKLTLRIYNAYSQSDVFFVQMILRKHTRYLNVRIFRRTVERRWHKLCAKWIKIRLTHFLSKLSGRECYLLNVCSILVSLNFPSSNFIRISIALLTKYRHTRLSSWNIYWIPMINHSKNSLIIYYDSLQAFRLFKHLVI